MPEPIQTPVPAADELAAQVLLLAQSRLTADLRFLSSALEQLKPIPVPALDTLFAGDGRCLYYCPETLLRTFRAQQSVPTRALLHVTLHFLLGHPFQRQEMDHRLWNLACDIAAEEVIRELEIPSCALPDDAMQDSWRSRLRDACPHLTAEAIYNFLLERQYPADVLAELTQLFSRDNHALWYAAPRPGSRPAPNGQLLPAGEDEDITNETELRKTDTRDETLQQMQQRQKEALRRQWKQLARQAKTDLETFSRRHGRRAGALMDGLEPVTFEECDYTDFLRRFGAQNEVLQLSEDEFDLIYYTYGLRTYGNVPLVEPLEYRDDKRIREFVIAIDTSGSVQGDIVQSFLQRTCDVLRQSGSFTERVEIYLIQCDAEVQSVERLTSLDQLHELIPRLKLRGFGGTDFRPVFAYVDRLLEEKKLTNLNGLLYFTDGVGTHPEKSLPTRLPSSLTVTTTSAPTFPAGPSGLYLPLTTSACLNRRRPEPRRTPNHGYSKCKATDQKYRTDLPTEGRSGPLPTSAGAPAAHLPAGCTRSGQDCHYAAGR
ncbi:MAG: VWA-like domain-containing protein [Faecalibacterium sp.]